MKVTSRFKGLDLIDRVPEELWMEVRDIAQEAVIKTISKKMKCKKEKWLSEEVLQIPVKRREVKKHSTYFSLYNVLKVNPCGGILQDFLLFLRLGNIPLWASLATQ